MSKADVEWKSEPLLNNKWLALSTQLRTQRGKRPTVDLIRALTQHPKYQDHNPNSIYALLGTFFRTGGPEFHRPDGMGYQLWVDSVLFVDKFNPQVAARLARALETGAVTSRLCPTSCTKRSNMSVKRRIFLRMFEKLLSMP